MNNEQENKQYISNEELVRDLAGLFKLLGVNLNVAPDFRIEKKKTYEN